MKRHYVCVCFIGLHNLLLAAEYVSDLVYFSFLSLTLANEWIRGVQNVNDFVWSFRLGTDSLILVALEGL